ncbi:c-type cytochrome [Sedimenticola hydrogenitrophicus]|uniref:c-type cytochrome n=1 Tax=Sedimenticola hydrogenitrophicus TaxID=2967975 RepID=UPI0023B10CDA|nr:cytochrome c [Sedimenticola hydrogenitrophicus]
MNPGPRNYTATVSALLGLLLALFASVSLATGITPDRHQAGREIYNFRCYFCHGYSGDANTLATTYLQPPPRDFTALAPGDLSRDQMLQAIREGRPGTAMKPFSRLLSEAEMELVADFIREEFILQRLPNTHYHSRENGWANHQRYQPAFPFADGRIPLDRPWEQLTPGQRQGKRLFLGSCISCHDRARVSDEGEPWAPDAVSYPRTSFATGDFLLPPDALTGASPFARHDIARSLDLLPEPARQGGELFLANCAFCHGADGSGRNWIGTFLEPHARDLTDDRFMAGMTPQRLRQVILHGLEGTSMPAWRSVLSDSQVESLILYIDQAIHPLAD